MNTGADGATGPQGPQGAGGATGPAGIGADRVLLALTCEKTSIGTGDNCASGIKSGLHDEVSIVLPFSGEILGGACKALKSGETPPSNF